MKLFMDNPLRNLKSQRTIKMVEWGRKSGKKPRLAKIETRDEWTEGRT